MEFLQLLTRYPTITDKILDNLETEDKRRLFFSSLTLQQELKRYKQLHDIATSAGLENICFYFPKLKLNPCCGRYPNCKNTYYLRRHVVRLEVNSNAIRLKCDQCSVYYFNAQGETEFQNCISHKNYYYSRGQMIIKKKNLDIIGRPWTDRAVFKPSQLEKALCYCQKCKKFLYYNNIEVGYKTATCIACLKKEFKEDRENNGIIIKHTWLGGNRAFCVPNATFRALRLY